MHWILVYTNTDEIFNHFLSKNVMDFAKKISTCVINYNPEGAIYVWYNLYYVEKAIKSQLN